MGGKIDLNKASEEELRKIEGVGDTMAKGIVEYRQQHGSFHNVDELDKVPGIARTMLDKVKSRVEIGGRGWEEGKRK